MFLSVLSKPEREVFLELAVQLANSDLEFSEDEANLINQYRIEMNLPEAAYHVKGLESRECLALYDNSSEQVRNIVYFELLGLGLCDEKFEDKEAEYLDKIRSYFNIGEKKANEMRSCINDLTATYRKIGTLLK